MISKMDHAPLTHGKTVHGIDASDPPGDGLPIKELKFGVDSLEERVTRSNSSERGGSSESSITHMEGRAEEIDITQKTMLKLFSDWSKDSKTTTPKIHCRPTIRISGFHPRDLGLILDNGILFSYFFCSIVPEAL